MSAERATPKVHEIRALLNGVERAPSALWGLGLFTLNLTAFVACYWTTLTVSAWPLRVISSVLLGLLIGSLFMVGHDAGHDSLTPWSRLNRLIARLTLMPGLHLPSSWDVEHNKLHHHWANFKGKDCVYVPPTWEEWQARSAWKRWLYRRTYNVGGIGLHYLARVWWPAVIALDDRLRRELSSRREYVFDLTLTASYVLAQIALVLAYGRAHGHTLPEIAADVAWVVILPFMVWMWIIAYVTLQHHTHPRVRWFDDADEWSFYQGQVRSSVHLHMPSFMDHLFQHIFDHTAHHTQPDIPSYRLPNCQSALEQALPSDVIVQPAGANHLRSLLKICRIYDYRRHCWLDFNGQPSTFEHWPGTMDRVDTA